MEQQQEKISLKLDDIPKTLLEDICKDATILQQTLPKLKSVPNESWTGTDYASLLRDLPEALASKDIFAIASSPVLMQEIEKILLFIEMQIFLFELHHQRLEDEKEDQEALEESEQQAREANYALLISCQESLETLMYYLQIENQKLLQSIYDNYQTIEKLDKKIIKLEKQIFSQMESISNSTIRITAHHHRISHLTHIYIKLSNIADDIKAGAASERDTIKFITLMQHERVNDRFHNLVIKLAEHKDLPYSAKHNLKEVLHDLQKYYERELYLSRKHPDSTDLIKIRNQRVNEQKKLNYLLQKYNYRYGQIISDEALESLTLSISHHTSLTDKEALREALERYDNIPSEIDILQRMSEEDMKAYDEAIQEHKRLTRKRELSQKKLDNQLKNQNSNLEKITDPKTIHQESYRHIDPQKYEDKEAQPKLRKFKTRTIFPEQLSTMSHEQKLKLLESRLPEGCLDHERLNQERQKRFEEQQHHFAERSKLPSVTPILASKLKDYKTIINSCFEELQHEPTLDPMKLHHNKNRFLLELTRVIKVQNKSPQDPDIKEFILSFMKASPLLQQTSYSNVVKREKELWQLVENLISELDYASLDTDEMNELYLFVKDKIPNITLNSPVAQRIARDAVSEHFAMIKNAGGESPANEMKSLYNSERNASELSNGAKSTPRHGQKRD